MKITAISVVYVADLPSLAAAAQGSFGLRGLKDDSKVKTPLSKVKNNLFDPPVVNVINGDDAVADRYPWIAQYRRDDGGLCCGGSLVAKNFVLTAAHCGCGNNVRIGHHTLSNDSEGEVRIIETEFRHPDYQGEDYDFKLLKLSSNSSYDPVAINPDADVPANFGDDLWVAGWGENEHRDYPDVLQEAMVPYQNCDDVWGGTTDREMCAERPVKNNIGDACRGDSGGPLFIKDTNDDPSKDVVVGVVSWGDYPCDQTTGGRIKQSYYGVYARISSEFAWIQETVCDKGGETAGTSFTCGSTPTTTTTSTTTTTETTTTTTGCGDGICGAGESCDGRDGTLECGDCDGKTNGKPSGRYCCVGGTCEGPGCSTSPSC